MIIFPAIDILGGNAVRLFQGDYAQKQVFGTNPAAFAQKFMQDCATHLHLVDLDGAKEGEPCNFGIVKDIAAEGNLFIELGGGIRTEEVIEDCLNANISRVILGTAALNDTMFTKKMAKKYPGKIAVGVDARDGFVAIEGWLKTSQTNSIDFCKEMLSIGIEYVIYTDISRDGAQHGANLAVYEQLAGIQGLNITASGGVSSLGDITALRDMGLYAAILGKALYTGNINLKDAIMVAKRGEVC